MLHREGIAIPRSTSISRDLLGASFKLEFDANVMLENDKTHFRLRLGWRIEHFQLF
jgi:hypothetical protein